MAWIHPLAVEHRRKLYTRQDAWRLAPPGTPEAKMPGWLDPSMTRVRWREAQEEEARAAFEAELAELRASHERAKAELAEINYDLVLRRLIRKFSPDQPRVPAGSPQGGQWTSGGSSAGDAAAADTQNESDSDGVTLSDTSPDPIVPGAQYANVIRICMAGSRSITLDRWNNVGDWWVDYTCADGFTFRKFGFGGKIKSFLPDPRY